MARDRSYPKLAAWLVGSAAVVAALIFLVPEPITRDPVLRLSLLLACLTVPSQWDVVKQAAAERAAAGADERRRPAADLLRHLFRESPFRWVNGWAALSLTVCVVLRWLVPGDWARGWYPLAVLVASGIVLRMQATSGTGRAGTGAAAGTPVPESLPARLEWESGDRSREVASVAELRDLLWRLHHEAAGQPVSVDLVLPGAPRAVIGLGEPESMVLTLPEAGPAQVAVPGPDGVAGVPVTYTDDREVVFPPGSEIPIDVAIEVLCAYFPTGELPREAAPGPTRRDYYHAPGAPAATRIVPGGVAVVADGYGRVLLQRRTDSGNWALPGGVMEVGETLEQCVVREVREETGLDIEITGLVGVYTDPGHVIAYADGEVRQQFSVAFRGRITGGRLRGSDESAEVRFVDPADFARLPIHESTRLRLRHHLDDRPAPYLG